MPSARNPTVLATAGLASVALLVSACGSSSGPDVAHLSSGRGVSSASSEGGGSSPESSASTQQKMVTFAKCMRANGVPDFPEPVEGHIEIHGGPGSKSGLDSGSAQSQAAQRQCRKLFPNGAEPGPQVQAHAQEQAVKFSACIRAHGMPNFADPEFLGNAVKLDGNKTFNPNSPQFKAAAKICLGHSGGPKAE